VCNAPIVVTLAEALDRLPKVELHCHVEGTMRPATLVELASRHGIELPTADPTELYRYDSLDGFLRVFWLVQSTLMTRDDWARLAYESVVDGAVHGLIHRESFFTPARHLAGGQDLADAAATALAPDGSHFGGLTGHRPETSAGSQFEPQTTTTTRSSGDGR
jgi:adenosine deaminase